MPIDLSWRSMLLGMRRTYCPRGSKLPRKMKFANGTVVMVCKKAASVFYATVTKLAGKGAEAKPRPKKVTQTVFEQTARNIANEFAIREWRFGESSPTLTTADVKGLVPPKVVPQKALLWKKACDSPKTPKHLKRAACQNWLKWLKAHGKKKTQETAGDEWIDWMLYGRR